MQTVKPVQNLLFVSALTEVMAEGVARDQAPKAMARTSGTRRHALHHPDPWFVHPDRPRRPGVRVHRKVGRNEPCPCGSGAKFKRCCVDHPIFHRYEPKR